MLKIRLVGFRALLRAKAGQRANLQRGEAILACDLSDGQDGSEPAGKKAYWDADDPRVDQRNQGLNIGQHQSLWTNDSRPNEHETHRTQHSCEEGGDSPGSVEALPVERIENNGQISTCRDGEGETNQESDVERLRRKRQRNRSDTDRDRCQLGDPYLGCFAAYTALDDVSVEIVRDVGCGSHDEA